MAYVERENISPEIALLRLNRPERLNAITSDLMREFLGRLDDLAADRACRAVILTGAGRGFCAGADIKGGDPITGTVPIWDSQKLFSEVTLRMRSLPQPIIAAVNGPATGGGLAFTVASDIRYAAQSARFAASFVRIGLSGCDMGTSWNLTRLVGTGRAHELLLTGRIIDADEACRIGLVLEVVPDGEVVHRAVKAAELIVQNSPLGVAMTKEVMWATTEIPGFRTAVELENRTQVLMTQTADQAEAVTAFLEKRAPRFTRG
ncbi:MAG: enoyl-CoA hydratase/isomerase family protein [Gammaproteobacteria bacterium]